jgi:hypothetical protein
LLGLSSAHVAFSTRRKVRSQRHDSSEPKPRPFAKKTTNDATSKGVFLVRLKPHPDLLLANYGDNPEEVFWELLSSGPNPVFLNTDENRRTVTS